MNLAHLNIYIFLLVVYTSFNHLSKCEEEPDSDWLTNLQISEVDKLPLIPPHLVHLINERYAKGALFNTSTNSYIPRNVWIAVRNISDVRPSHYYGN